MIIDFHTHAFPEKIASRTLASLAQTANFLPFGDGTRQAVERNLRDAGADFAVVLNIVTKPGQENTINNIAAENDLFVTDVGNMAYFGSVHPDSPNALEEIARIHSLGLRGIKLHPDYQNFFVDEERLFPLYEKISELGLLLVFHAGYDPVSPDAIHAAPEKSALVLKEFPKLKMVLAHYGAFGFYDEVERYLAGRFENLYLDTAFSAGYIPPEQAKRIIAMQGADRILFGSDFPWHETKTELGFLDSLHLSEHDRELILCTNAKRLLGL